MKIALINLSSAEFKYTGNLEYPLGLLYLGAMVKKDHDVFILDFPCNSLSERINIMTRLEQISPDVVGISTTLDITLHSTKVIAREVRKTFPEAIIMLGGITAFFLKDALIKEPYVDIIVLREGDLTFKECIEYLDTGKDLGDVKGILFKKDGKILETPPAGLIEDLDSLPFPDFDLMNEKIKANLPISSSRGCGMGCIYCASTAFWGKWRPRSAENVIKEIETLGNKYGVDKIHFVDENFAFNPRRVRELCQLIEKKKLNLLWGGSARPELLNKELLQIMRQAGCLGIFIGAESGSERMLKKIKRNYTPEKIEEIVNDCISVGIIPTTSFIIGLPGEKREDVELTFQLMKNLNTFNLELSMLYPLYGTPIYNHPKAFGLTFLEERKNMDEPNMMKSVIETENFSTHELESLYYKGLGIIKRKTHNKGVFLKKILKEDTYVFQ